VQDVKYLVVVDRLDYSNLVIDAKQTEELTDLWDKIFAEYNSLEKNFGVTNFINDQSKILYFFALYLQEQAIFKSLLYRTNAGYIRFLRQRGYTLSNKSNVDYWQSLYDGLKQVENHMTQIEMLRNKMGEVNIGASTNQLFIYINQKHTPGRTEMRVDCFVKFQILSEE